MFNIEKSKNFLLSEIKINNPSIGLEIIKSKTSDKDGRISDRSLDALGIRLRRGSYSHVNLFKDYLYYSPSLQNQEDIPEISNILNSRGIKNDIITWYHFPYIKILKKYYTVT